MSNEHRAPWDCVFSKEEGDDCRPGAAPADEREYFEILCLCLLQAGLNWGSVRKHWPRYREGFHGFSPERLARARPQELLESPNVIRHPKKGEAVVHNAREFLAILEEHGSFKKFLGTLKPLGERERQKALAKRFKHVGPETADYFLHSVGFYEGETKDSSR
jgi:DNA-3-methyladenine glycosylase I